MFVMTVRAFILAKESQIPGGLSLYTAEDVRSLLGRSLAVLAKTEWS